MNAIDKINCLRYEKNGRMCGMSADWKKPKEEESHQVESNVVDGPSYTPVSTIPK